MAPSYYLTGRLVRHEFGDGHSFYTGTLPESLIWSEKQFEQAWELHPSTYHQIMMFGRLVKTPRWQQAYGRDYHYTGKVNEALPIPELLQPLLDWAQKAIHRHLNGLLVNWYDGDLRHYIGPHHDSISNMVKDAPIVTLSFGEGRTFRLSKGKDKFDFTTTNGSVFVMPYDTNLAWKHSVLHRAGDKGRRISVTVRAFN